MSANEPNRATMRAVLAGLIEAKCVTSTAHAQEVYAYQKDDFAGASPVIVVTGAGSAREQQTFGAEDVTTFAYDVHTFVLYAATGWTEADSENRIDLLEKEIADVIVDNRSGTAYWHYSDATQIDAVVIGGEDYRHEVIPVGVILP